MAVEQPESPSYSVRVKGIQNYLQSPSEDVEKSFTHIDWMAMRIAFTHSPTLSSEMRRTIQKKSFPFLQQCIPKLRESLAKIPSGSPTNDLQSLKDLTLDCIKICDLSYSLSNFKTNQEEDNRIEDQHLKEWFDVLQSSLHHLEQSTRLILYLALARIRTLHPKWLKLPSVEELKKQSLFQEPVSDSESQHLPPSIQEIIKRVDHQLNSNQPVTGLASIVAILSETPIVTTEREKKELLKQATDYTQFLCESIEALNTTKIKGHTQQLLHRLNPSSQNNMKDEQQLLEELGALYQSTQIWQKKNKSLKNCLLFPPDDPDYQAFRNSYQHLLTLVQKRAQQTRKKPNHSLPDPLSVVYYYPFDQLQRKHILDPEVVDFLTFANPSFDATAKEKVFWVVQSLFPPMENKNTISKHSLNALTQSKPMQPIQNPFPQNQYKGSFQSQTDKDKELYHVVMRQLSLKYINKGQPVSTYSEENQTYLQNTLFPYIFKEAKKRGWKTSYPFLHGLVRENIEVDVPEEWQRIDMQKKCSELAQNLLDQLQNQSPLNANEVNLYEKAKTIDPQSDPSILVDENLATLIFMTIKETRKQRNPLFSRNETPMKVPEDAKIFSKSEAFTREVQNLILQILHKNSQDYSPQEAFIASVSFQEPVAMQNRNYKNSVTHYLEMELTHKVERVKSDPNYPEENLAFELATTRVAIETIRQNSLLLNFGKSNQVRLPTFSFPEPHPQLQTLLSSVKELGEWCKRESEKNTWKQLSLMPSKELLSPIPKPKER